MATPQPKPALAKLPPDAHVRSGFIERWRFRVAVTAVLVLAAWRLLDHSLYALPGATWHTPGPVAFVHAPWEADCGACHRPFTPLSDDNWLARATGTRRAADQQCRDCHAGADHHNAENDGHRAGCTGCHREHRGKESSLVAMEDAVCTRCHQDLKSHLAADARSAFLDVSRFDANREHHPEFRALRERVDDPGRLHFSHHLHLTPGMRRVEGGEAFTLADLEARSRGSYRRPADSAADEPVHIKDCAWCHRLDDQGGPFALPSVAGVPLSAVHPARSQGAVMLPVVYEKHCQVCHPLSFERGRGDDPASRLYSVPHRLQPAELRLLLQGHFVAQALRPRAPAPGRPVKPADKEPWPVIESRAALSALVHSAEQELYLSQKGCGQCHSWKPEAHPLPPDRLSELRVQPTRVNQIGLEHAVFNHTSHRLLECRVCHAATADSPDSKDVLLPGIDTCVRCHGPGGEAGGARHGCVTCHRYHEGDHPLSGRGSTGRAGPAAGSRTVEQFLRVK
jgi:predicted CXXCH cytochrome family protein